MKRKILYTYIVPAIIQELSLVVRCHDGFGNGPGQSYGNCIPNLSTLFLIRPCKSKVVRKRLQPRQLPHGEKSVSRIMLDLFLPHGPGGNVRQQIRVRMGIGGQMRPFDLVVRHHRPADELDQAALRRRAVRQVPQGVLRRDPGPPPLPVRRRGRLGQPQPLPDEEDDDAHPPLGVAVVAGVRQLQAQLVVRHEGVAEDPLQVLQLGLEGAFDQDARDVFEHGGVGSEIGHGPGEGVHQPVVVLVVDAVARVDGGEPLARTS
mmetsp:Transcript_36553/g.85452  ORF Transcript_36553/g.85452 Transcript_36553/m.85452 type:complete len:262 (+) Transcript_36553:140-925(+)